MTTTVRRTFTFAVVTLILVGLYLFSRHSYLLFHSLVELFCVVVAACIFVIAWNTRHLHKNSYFLVLGIAYLHVGGLDLMHTLAYSGMGVLATDDPDPSTQPWLASRALEVVSLIVALAFVRRNVHTGATVTIYVTVSTGLLALIAAGLFPECFNPETGLTMFKKSAEYVISGLLVLAAVGLIHQRDAFDRGVLNTMFGAIMVTVAAELAFTFYTDPFGVANLLGHYLKWTVARNQHNLASGL